MLNFYQGVFILLLIGTNGTFIDFIEYHKNILHQWKKFIYNLTEVEATTNGVFDVNNLKNKILQWKAQKITAHCPSNGAQLQNLLNLVCSTAQPTNVTARDSCISCFSSGTSMQEGPQELNALSSCATQYFTNTSYASCASTLMTLATSALNVQPTGCYMGYCDFVRCLRRTNSVNLITQCTREARTGVNITLDTDNVRFYTNVTSCILAKSRCGSYNPITGEPQVPGYTTSGTRVSNALQFSASGELRVLSFSTNTPVTNSFCSAASNLSQTTWLTNIC